MEREIRAVQRYYPQIYLACHTRHVRASSTDETLSPRDGALLAHLDETHAVGATELARHLGLALSTVSEAVDFLERLGYVTRVRSARDKRATELRLSRKGATIMQRSSVLDTARVRQVLDLLGPKDRARAVEGLGLLARASQRAMLARASQRAMLVRASSKHRRRSS